MQPTHPRANWATDIIRGVGTFAELEDRVAALSLEKDRGDAFEVFVEAYLATQPIAQTETIWAANSVPAAIRQQLNLPSSDFGADGVYRDRNGDLIVYQAKFRTGRPSLSWRELSTFFGIAEKADQRVLLTNTDAIAGVAEQRTNFHSFRGADFERLDASDFERMAAWLASGVVQPVKREPRPHQIEALSNIESGLKEHDRATVVMACGTGKTLISLWAAEKASQKRVLVLVPSLALLRQTLHEWARFTRWGEEFRFLCVCSDPSVSRGIDALTLRPEDSDFPVSTDAHEVERFLAQADDSVRVVFSTYQSAHVVAEGMNGSDIFDIGIFDEAHKTTGREGSRFAFALSDDNLPIRKRLFFTATPRHYDIRKKDKEGDVKLVFSMDNEAVYGPVVHKLSFAEAAKRDIICNYKVVISVVDGAMVDNHLLNRGEVLVKDDFVRARQVAVQLALQRAVEEFGVGRIITFHSSVKAASGFVAEGAEGVHNHLPAFSTYHVNGKQRTADREDHLRGFAEANKGLITNARCLTEGVDVPAVDMVAFVNPRRSKIDIVQATGRAMRKAGPEKDYGYILLPLFLEREEGETLEDALERSQFSEVADVLNAMQEQDEELTEIIRLLQVEKGQLGEVEDSRLVDKLVTIGPEIGLAELKKAVSAELIDTLGGSWDERYGQLVAYKDRFGDCNVPSEWPENTQLGRWAGHQRENRKANNLSEDRFRRLDELGFIWDTKDTLLEERFAALVSYKDRFGDCNVPGNWAENPQLGTWVGRQRAHRKANKLDEDRIRRLDEVGFVWNPFDAAWEEMFADLAEYKNRVGDSNVPSRWPENPLLGKWAQRQRVLRKANKLDEGRIRRLDELGFVWNPFDAAWDGMLAALVTYKDRFGDCNVPSEWPENPQLGKWVGEQRNARKVKKLDANRVRRLDEVGFVWNLIDTVWEEMFAALAEYKGRFGDCNVPKLWPENKKLSLWVVTQRARRNANKLDGNRVRRLDELGFVWNPIDAAWDGMFNALVTYKDRFGDCNVPNRWPENSQLGTWVGGQRVRRKANKLDEGRIRRLDELGFVWDTLSAAWEEMFDALVIYKDRFGDCNVPSEWPENPQLGQWVSGQRKARKANTLSEDRIHRLDEVGFVWDRSDRSDREHRNLWEKKFAALVAYKDRFGDCNVPSRWSEDRQLQLGKWVVTQRASRKANTLSEDRIHRLDEVGFVWDTKNTLWDEMFAALAEYKDSFGDCNVPQNSREKTQLGTWVSTQRGARKANTLAKDKIHRLDELGFEWSRAGKRKKSGS